MLSLARQLKDIVTDCAGPDWDGYGAEPVLPVVIERAMRLLELLPTGVAQPDSLGPEPDGCVALDWSRTTTQQLSVSVSAEGGLSFAWLNGPDHGYGVVEFNGQSFPRELLTLIEAATQ